MWLAGVWCCFFALERRDTGQRSIPENVMPQAITPTVLSVNPNEAPTNLDATVVIAGTDFQAALSGTLVLTGLTLLRGEKSDAPTKTYH
jgi:hypothetical protein